MAQANRKTFCIKCGTIHYEAMRNGPYLLVHATGDYPGKKYRNRYVYQHHFVWWAQTGQVVPHGFVVHHKNENMHDNRYENLELIESERHKKLHGHFPHWK